MRREVILTGVRANEEPTLGNFLGAYVPMVELSNKHAKTHQVNMFVPDLHSFTTSIDHSTLYDNVIRGVKYYIAAGLDINNENIYIYRQSHIPAHSEMTWILNCFTYFGEMERMTQFKDKSGRVSDMEVFDNIRDIAEKFISQEHLKETKKLDAVESMKDIVDLAKKVLNKNLRSEISVGLFDYPVLMAADILLYDAKYVPLGEDQFQHLEMTRNIAERMNRKFGELFTVPANTAEQSKFIGREKGLRIRSLIDPAKKMSKSDTNASAKILLNDNPDEAAKKIMKATTDNFGVINYDFNKQPGISSLLQIMSLLSNKTQEEVNSEWVGKTNYGDFKKAVADKVKDFLNDFQAKVDSISDKQVLSFLEDSEAKMTKIANTKLYKVQAAIGLRKE